MRMPIGGIAISLMQNAMDHADAEIVEFPDPQANVAQLGRRCFVERAVVFNLFQVIQLRGHHAWPTLFRTQIVLAVVPNNQMSEDQFDACPRDCDIADGGQDRLNVIPSGF